MTMRPVSGVSNPARIRSSVVFPDPDGPTIAVLLPGATLRFKLSSTCTSENDLEMAVNSSMS